MSMLSRQDLATINKLKAMHAASAPTVPAAAGNMQTAQMQPTVAKRELKTSVFNLTCANATGATKYYYFLDNTGYHSVLGTYDTAPTGGNYGATTDTILKALTNGRPCRLKSITIQSASGASIAIAGLKLYEVGYNEAKQVQLNYMPLQEQLNTSVYNFLGINVTLDSGTMGVVSVAANDTVTIYFEIEYVTEAYLMS